VRWLACSAAQGFSTCWLCCVLDMGVGLMQVHLLARGEKLRASRSMQDRALDHKKVTVHFNTAVDDAYPDGKGALAGLHIKDTKTGQPAQA